VEVAGEDRRLVAACRCADLEEHIVVVERIRRHEQALQSRLIFGHCGLERGDLLFRERAQARVAVGRHRARRRQFAFAREEAGKAARDRVDAREFHGQFAEPVRTAEHRGIGEHALDLGMAVGDALEPAADRFLHGGSRRNRRAAASASEPSPLSAASRSAADGACSRRFVSVAASCSSTCSGRMAGCEHRAALPRAPHRAQPRPGRAVRGSSARHPAP
jgi:hypothetical protein